MSCRPSDPLTVRLENLAVATERRRYPENAALIREAIAALEADRLAALAPVGAQRDVETWVVPEAFIREQLAPVGVVDEAMLVRAHKAYDKACAAGKDTCPRCEGTGRLRDHFTECDTCEGSGWKWREDSPNPMRAALEAAITPSREQGEGK